MPPQSDYGAIPSGTDDEKRPLNAIERRGGNQGRKVLLFALAVVVVFFIYTCYSSTVDSKDDGGVYGWIPDTELGLKGVDREEDASPSFIWGNKTNGPLPTNSWYLVRLVNWYNKFFAKLALILSFWNNRISFHTVLQTQTNLQESILFRTLLILQQQIKWRESKFIGP
jgi:hypothetical protein